jgi:hypothetical protein
MGEIDSAYFCYHVFSIANLFFIRTHGFYTFRATMETIPLGAPVSFQNMSRRIAWDATTVINPNAHGTALTIIPTTPTSNRVRGTRDVLTSHGPGTHEAMSMSLGGGVGKFPWGNSKRSARDKVLPKSPPPPPTPGTRAVRSPESPRDGGVGSGRRIELGGVERDDEIDAEEEARRDYPAHLRRLRAALAHSADASGTFLHFVQNLNGHSLIV